MKTSQIVEDKDLDVNSLCQLVKGVINLKDHLDLVFDRDCPTKEITGNHENSLHD
jgi:hypothetical protein